MVCCSSRKARCTRPCIDSRRPAKSSPSGKRNRKAAAGHAGGFTDLTTKGHRELQGRGEWQTFVATLGGILLNGAGLSAEAWSSSHKFNIETNSKGGPIAVPEKYRRLDCFPNRVSGETAQVSRFFGAGK